MVTRDQEDPQDLWGEGSIRVFVSHTAANKNDATYLKARLEVFGMAAFVAHEDIEPMREWVIEIERALSSMDMLLALLTEDFIDSKWTDQEVGFAVGRGVPVIPVRMGTDPYGFMARYQAIQGSADRGQIARAVFEYALEEDTLKDRSIDTYISAVEKSGGFDSSNSLAKLYPRFVGCPLPKRRAWFKLSTITIKFTVPSNGVVA